MECVLYISYRLEIKCWQIKKNCKDIVHSRKLAIQKRFREETGLLIDMPTANAGNTNDGNTARRFFKNAETSSEITGVNLELIKRFGTILAALNCGLPINVTKFSLYAEETANIYLTIYSWYYMPVTRVSNPDIRISDYPDYPAHFDYSIIRIF